MDRVASTKRDVVERMLFDESVDPTDLPLSLLEYITNSFSEDKQIDKGGFSVVYKGMLRNGTIAVKKLFDMPLHEDKFHEEVTCLMKAKHKNVVRFFGYCADTQGRMESYNGKLVMADVQQRLLCFEYLPKGSLHDYITDASHELEWTQYYQIIKGICTGLHYLHKNHIAHLDLKPSNILLDDNMVPKIADFGLSRCFDENQSHVITSKRINGTLGYLAPESYCGRIAFKSDIYSLGVIITQILTGEKMCPEDYDVLERWGNRLEQLYKEKQLEQLRVCAEIGKECTEYDPRRRPDALTIVRRLDEVDIEDRSIVTEMRNLSIQQAEQHGDGRNLIGLYGSILEKMREKLQVIAISGVTLTIYLASLILLIASTFMACLGLCILLILFRHDNLFRQRIKCFALSVTASLALLFLLNRNLFGQGIKCMVPGVFGRIATLCLGISIVVLALVITGFAFLSLHWLYTYIGSLASAQLPM